MTTEAPQPVTDAPKRKGRHWPLIIVGMLLAHASLMIGTIVYVGAKHDLHVEEDYYAKSVDWDNQRELMGKADEMGWDVAISADVPPSAGERPQERDLRVTLTDASGAPIDGALIEVELIHPAHIGDRQAAVLHETDKGVYARPLALSPAGYWRANLSIRHRGVRALLTREVEIN